MTVKQLINKLKKMPEDATVFVYNNNSYINGIYKVESSEVKHFGHGNSVVIGTDYKHKEEQMMDSKLAIATIKESCYKVGYSTNDAEHERRKLINESCDYAIECIKKIEQIKKVLEKQEENNV